MPRIDFWKKLIIGALVSLIFLPPVTAQKQNISKPKMDQERLARIPMQLKSFVERGAMAGAVTLIARRGRVISVEAIGYRSSESNESMLVDTVFDIRSVTKPVTAIGIMILMERLTMRWTIFHLSCAALISLLSLNSSHAQTLANCRPAPPMPPNVKPGVVGFDLSRDGRTLLVAGGDGMIRFVDITSGHVLRTFTGHTNAVYRAIFNHDEKLIASSSRDLTARVWDWTTGRELWQASGFRCSVKAVEFSPDGRLLAVAGNDGMVKLYHVKSGKELRSLVHINSATIDMAVYSLAFGRDASKVYAGNGDGTISEWELLPEKKRERGRHIREPPSSWCSVLITRCLHQLVVTNT